MCTDPVAKASNPGSVLPPLYYWLPSALMYPSIVTSLYNKERVPSTTKPLALISTQPGGPSSVLIPSCLIFFLPSIHGRSDRVPYTR